MLDRPQELPLGVRPEAPPSPIQWGTESRSDRDPNNSNLIEPLTSSRPLSGKSPSGRRQVERCKFTGERSWSFDPTLARDVCRSLLSVCFPECNNLACHEVRCALRMWCMRYCHCVRTFLRRRIEEECRTYHHSQGVFDCTAPASLQHSLVPT